MITASMGVFGFEWKPFCYSCLSWPGSGFSEMNKPTALIFFGILVLGLIISLFSLKNCRKIDDDPLKPEIPSVGTIDSSKVKEDAKETKPLLPKPVESPTTATPDAPAAKPAKGRFASAEAAMTALAEKAAARDFAGFLSVVGNNTVKEEDKEGIRKLVESPDLQVSGTKPFSELSKSVEGMRWALNFAASASDSTTDSPESAAPEFTKQLYADFVEAAGNGVDLSGIALPLDPEAPASGATSNGKTPLDALSVAHAFSKAVIRRDFNTARTLSDPATVSDERVAALMIAVEEGNFTLKEDRPLVVTLAREDTTWVLTRVQSETAASEFAMELGQVNQSWLVNGLTFSKVLSVLAENAGGGDVAYSPIVEDPAGGDSLVIYFEFDEAGLTSRAQRQLAIVADILSQGAERVIRINGHADALGSEDYNVALSDGRAESIRQALISLGVSPDQVVTEGFGAAKPRSPNFLPDGSDNPGGRSKNRRAEVLLDF